MFIKEAIKMRNKLLENGFEFCFVNDHMIKAIINNHEIRTKFPEIPLKKVCVTNLFK